MDGVSLCARFSIATNRLQFCGPSDAEPALYAAIVEGKGTAAARTALAQFEALYPYLAAIGERHGRDPFDREVVEAYWIGNELLEGFGAPEFRRLLDTLVARGLSRRAAERLTAHLPDGSVPHHAFHVAFVGVGEVTGHVPTTLANLESCRPALGRVTGRAPGRIEVERVPWVVGNGRLEDGAPTRTWLSYDDRILGSFALGAAVAVHWSHPAIVLSEPQAERLQRWTTRSREVANRALPALRALDPGPAAAGAAQR